MAIVRRNPEEYLSTPTAFGRTDPFELVRQMLRWDPFREIVSAAGTPSAFAPAFEVKETGDAYLFRADLPGVAEKDVEISLTGNRLTVNGKREAEEREEGENYYALERSYGAFTRSFTLPEGVDADKVDAELRNGVLTVRIPKLPETLPKKISVKAKGALEGMVEKVKSAMGKEKGSEPAKA